MISFKFVGRVRLGVIIANLREIVIARIGVAALAILQIIADAVVIVALHNLHLAFDEQGIHTIRMRSECAKIAETKNRIV